MLEEQMFKFVNATNKANWEYHRNTYHAMLEIHTEQGKLHHVQAVYAAKASPTGRNTIHAYKRYGIQNAAFRGGGHAIQVWVNPSEGKVLDAIGDSHEMLPYFTTILKKRIGGTHVWVGRINDAFLVKQLPPYQGFQVFKFFGLTLMDLVPDARKERNESLLKMIKL